MKEDVNIGLPEKSEQVSLKKKKEFSYIYNNIKKGFILSSS